MVLAPACMLREEFVCECLTFYLRPYTISFL